MGEEVRVELTEPARHPVDKGVLEIVGHEGPLRGPSDEEDHLFAAFDLVYYGCDALPVKYAAWSEFCDRCCDGIVCNLGGIVP